MSKKQRIPKHPIRIIEDFFDHTQNLKESISLYNRNEQRAIKSILHCLRVLITKDGLLVRLNKQFDLALGVRSKRLQMPQGGGPIVETINGKSLEEWLNSESMILNGKPYSRAKFVWEIASQNSVHEDEGIDPDLVIGESIHLMGTTVNNYAIASIARTIDSVCDVAVDALKKEFTKGHFD